MIASLTGPVLEIGLTSAVLECSGVGYQAFCPSRTLSTLSVGQTARLFTFLVVREDSLTLYGFDQPAEKAFFEQLINVNGVGPKIGLSLLSTFTVDDIRAAVMANQPAQLARAQGVGKKLAEKIILDLKDKLGQLPQLPAATGNPASSMAQDIASALVNLGYPQRAAENAAAEALKRRPNASFADLFRTALHHTGA